MEAVCKAAGARIVSFVRFKLGALITVNVLDGVVLRWAGVQVMAVSRGSRTWSLSNRNCTLKQEINRIRRSGVATHSTAKVHRLACVPSRELVVPGKS